MFLLITWIAPASTFGSEAVGETVVFGGASVPEPAVVAQYELGLEGADFLGSGSRETCLRMKS